MARRFHYRRPRTRTRYVRAAPRRRRSFRSFFKRRTSHTIPLSYLPAVAVPLGFMISGDSHMMGLAKAMESGNMGTIAHEVGCSLAYQTVGFDPNQNSWDWGILARNIGLAVAGMVVHRLARPVNAKIRNIPLIGKYVSI